jgi:hypothetical protein
MPEPTFKCILHGKQYHKNKPKFKKILKEYGMEYGGSFAYPYWGGESEYVRGEFQRELNEQTGEEETKVATISLFLRENREPTQFSKDFKAWCREAEGLDANSEIEPTEKPKAKKKSKKEDWKRLIAVKFRGSGKRELSKQDIVFGISFDRKWASPKEANELVEKAIRLGYLEKKGDKLIPTFDVQEVEYPASYRPDTDEMSKEAEYTEE